MPPLRSAKNHPTNFRFIVLTFAALALWVASPFLLQLVSVQTHAAEAPAISFTATLTGQPIASVTPRGTAVYSSPTSTLRQLSVSVTTVNLATGTQLPVFVNSTSVGMITLDAMKRGELSLTTGNGGTVPTIVAGATLSVKNGTTTILTGVFVAPPTPTPTPTPLPVIHFFAQMTGPAIGGMVPRGLSEYESRGTNRELETYVSFVNLPENTVLAVTVGTGAVGNITLRNRAGSLRLSTDNGGTVPTVINGTTITIKNGTTTILSGTFSDMPPTPSPTPTHSPTPTPSHTPTPTPTGTPLPASAFAARLRGSSVVPPVTTEGRGSAFVRLNTAGTEISVRVGYFRLGTAATTVTINGPAAADANGPVIFTLANTGGTSGSTTTQTFAVNAAQVAQLRNGVWYVKVSTIGKPTGEIRGQIRSINHHEDFTGDGLADISIIRNAESDAPDNAAFNWYVLGSVDNKVSISSIGHVGDVNVQGDYDGDGIADLAMFTPADGTWQIRGSATGETRYYHWGTAGDIPVVGDYDGDSVNDLTVYRPSQGLWYVQNSSDGTMVVTRWGLNGDKPVSGDFDGDGLNDLAVFRPSNGVWYINLSSGGAKIMQWGLAADRPVSGDFDGDGITDIAVFRPSQGVWYIYRSSDNMFTAFQFGLNGDIPVPCAFDVDGQTDIAVFRPSDGNWYILRSSDRSMAVYHFGVQTDRPTATVYTP